MSPESLLDDTQAEKQEVKGYFQGVVKDMAMAAAMEEVT